MKENRDKPIRKCAPAEDLLQQKHNSFRTGNVSV